MALRRKIREHNVDIYLAKKDQALQQKIDHEIRMRDGTAKLLAASKHPQQMLEAAKNLLTSNQRMMAYMGELQRRRTSEVIRRELPEEGNQVPCKARISVSDVRVPLMWKDAEHFKNKGDHRRYAAFCLIKIGTEIYDTALLKDIDRTMTDLAFDDVLCFGDMAPDFECRLEVYCHRCQDDLSVVSTPKRIRKKIEDFGNSVGRSVGRRLSGLKDDSDPNMIIGPKFECLGAAMLKLADVSETMETFNLTLESDTSGMELPLFGNICCRLAAQPSCLVQDTVSGTLHIQDPSSLSWTPYWCRLRNLSISCWQAREHAGIRQPAVRIPVTKTTQISEVPVSLCQRSHCIQLSSQTFAGRESYNIAADGQDDKVRWWDGIYQHLLDQVMWLQACESVMDIRAVTPRRHSVYRRKGLSMFDETSTTDSSSPMTKMLNRLNIPEQREEEERAKEGTEDKVKVTEDSKVKVTEDDKVTKDKVTEDSKVTPDAKVTSVSKIEEDSNVDADSKCTEDTSKDIENTKASDEEAVFVDSKISVNNVDNGDIKVNGDDDSKVKDVEVNEGKVSDSESQNDTNMKDIDDQIVKSADEDSDSLIDLLEVTGEAEISDEDDFSDCVKDSDDSGSEGSDVVIDAKDVQSTPIDAVTEVSVDEVKIEEKTTAMQESDNIEEVNVTEEDATKSDDVENELVTEVNRASSQERSTPEESTNVERRDSEEVTENTGDVLEKESTPDRCSSSSSECDQIQKSPEVVLNTTATVESEKQSEDVKADDMSHNMASVVNEDEQKGKGGSVDCEVPSTETQQNYVSADDEEDQPQNLIEEEETSDKEGPEENTKEDVQESVVTGETSKEQPLGNAVTDTASGELEEKSPTVEGEGEDDASEKSTELNEDAPSDASEIKASDENLNESDVKETKEVDKIEDVAGVSEESEQLNTADSSQESPRDDNGGVSQELDANQNPKIDSNDDNDNKEPHSDDATSDKDEDVTADLNANEEPKTPEQPQTPNNPQGKTGASGGKSSTPSSSSKKGRKKNRNKNRKKNQNGW